MLCNHSSLSAFLFFFLQTYISTSDVTMHASCHRKDAQIIQEGFQRFRGHENCHSQGCPFMDQKSTHFHCKRDNCNFTFKNKSDMGTCGVLLGLKKAQAV